MTSRDFCYWLQGLFELGSPASLDATQTTAVKAHLDMVFAHEIDPSMGDAGHQSELNKIHDAVKAIDKKTAELDQRTLGSIVLRC